MGYGSSYGGGGLGGSSGASAYGPLPPGVKDWNKADTTGDYVSSNQGALPNGGMAGYYYMRDAAQKGADAAASRDPLSMRAAALDPYTKMQYASAGPGAMAGYNTIDQSKADEARAAQMGLMGNLQTQANGGGPSLAAAMLKSGTDQGLAAQMAAAGSQKGVGQSALAGRNLALMGAQSQGQLAQQSAMARMQEQLSAQQQLGGLSSSIRGQDLGVAGQQAALNQQTGLANQGAQNQFALANAGFQQQAYGANAQAANAYGLQQGQFNQQAAQANLGSAMHNRDAADQYGQWNYGNQFDAYQRAADRQAGIAQQNADRSQRQGQYDTAERDKWLSTAGTAAMMIAMSDEKQKKDVEGGDEGLKKFLKAYGGAGGFNGGPDSLTAGMSSAFGGDAAKKSALVAPSMNASLAGVGGRDLYGDPTYMSAGAPGSYETGGRMAKPISGDYAAGGLAYLDRSLTPSSTYDYSAPAPAGAPSVPQMPEVSMPTYAAGQQPEVAMPTYAAKSGASPDMLKMQKDLDAIQLQYAKPTLSDENEKTDVAKSSGLKDFLSPLGAHSYRYKDPSAPGAGPGRYTSPMAQELEKSEIGKSAVVEGPDGVKMVDYGKLSGASLAALAMHEKRLEHLEKGKAA